jgi:hypothetical protein
MCVCDRCGREEMGSSAYRLPEGWVSATCVAVGTPTDVPQRYAPGGDLCHVCTSVVTIAELVMEPEERKKPWRGGAP